MFTHSMSKYRKDCEECGKTFNRKTNYRLHIATVHSSFPCKKCEDEPHFDSKIKFITHAVEVHSDASYVHLKCKTCPKIFMNKTLLRNHEVTVHKLNISEKLADTTCSVCAKVFPTRSSYNLHYASHLDDRSHLCTTCGMAFKTKATLKGHSVIHTDIEFSCTKCDKSFKTSERLKRHDKRHLKEEYALLGKPLFTCSHCSEGFFSEYQYKKHKISTHRLATENSKGDYKCTHCDEVFHTRPQLVKHLNKEHKDTSLGNTTCDVCGATFTRAVALRTHLQIHTNSYSIKCGECGKGFSCESLLQRHEYKHLDEAQFNCDECQKCFRDPGSLRVHKRKHAILKGESAFPHVCEVCEKGFLMKSQLALHMATHDPDRESLICELCGKTLVGPQNLKTHLRNVHLTEKKKKRKQSNSESKSPKTKIKKREGESLSPVKEKQVSDNGEEVVEEIEILSDKTAVVEETGIVESIVVEDAVIQHDANFIYIDLDSEKKIAS